MRKRILSLLLVLAMLVSVFPAVAANETALNPKFTTFYLTLNESIAVNFKAVDLNSGNFDRVEFWKDGELSQSITKLPAEKDGGYAFRFTDLSPDELGKKITVKLFVQGSDESVHTIEKSVKDYCKIVLSSSAYNDEIKAVVVDLLNYGAAFQTYKGETDPNALVNADLTAAEKAYGTQETPKLESITSAGDQSGYDVKWYSFGLTLKEVVRVYFNIKAESMEGLSLKMTVAGKSWDITEFEYDATKDLYRADFDKLNPVQMSEVITAQIFAGDEAVSSVLTTSIESYAANTTDEKVKAVVAEMMKYGGATKTWIEGENEDDGDDDQEDRIPVMLEDFSDTTLSKWALSAAKPEGFTIAVNDDGALEIDMASTGKIDYDTYFDEYKGNVTYELDFKLELNGCTAFDPCIIIARGKNAKGQSCSLVNLKVAISQNGTMYFNAYDGSGSPRSDIVCEEGKTYHIQMYIDLETDTYDFLVDGKFAIEGGKLREDAVSVTGARIMFNRTGGDTAPNATFDNIAVWQGNTVKINDVIDGVVIEGVEEIYVSADAEVGQGDGSFENPFATVLEAKDLIRKIKEVRKYPEKGITVYLREGKYSVLNTIVFDAKDSGVEGAPVVYSAYNDEKVEFVGGFSIDASQFVPVTDPTVLSRLADKENVKQLDMKALGITDYGQMHVYGMAAGYFDSVGIPIQKTPAPELFFNDDIMNVAKYPDEGWLRIASVIETGDVIQNWTNGAFGDDFIPPEDRPPIDQITGSTFTVQRSVKSRMARWAEASDIWVYGFWKEDWSDQSMPVEYMDAATGTVKTEIPSGKQITMNRRFYFYNLLEEITVPGEYYMDRENGILYAYLPGETGNLTYGSLEGPLLRFANGSHDIEFSGIEFTAGRTHGIKMESAKRLTVRDCQISKFAMQAISMNDCEDITVTGCHIFETGTGGISVGYSSARDPYKTARETLEPLGILIENCEIHDFSRIKATYSPAISTGGVGMVVRNCKIYNGDHMAISLGGNDTIIENCEIFNVLRTVSDSGALYCGFGKNEMGIIVRNNYVHDVYSSAGNDFSFVYMDDTKDGITVESNLVVNFGGRGALINGGWDNTFRNNVLINVHTECTLGCIGMNPTLRYNVAEGGNYTGFINVYNAKYPAYNKYPHWEGKLEKLLEEGNCPRYNVIEDNVLVNVRNDALSSVGSRLPMWSAADSLANNTVKSGHKYELDDIGFADYANGDFTIREDSALFDDIENFKAYDFSQMGLFDEAVEKPEGFGGEGYDNGSNDDGNGNDFETVITDDLFVETFPDNDLNGWQLDAPNGVTTEVTDAGQLEIVMSGLGTANHVARFGEYAGRTVYETDFKIDLNGCTSIDSGIIIVKGKNVSGNEVSLVNLKVHLNGSGMTFGAYDGSGTTKSSVVCEDGKNYRAKVICDPDTDTYDFYIDDEPVIIGGKLRDDAVSFTGVCINQQKNTEGPAPTFTYDNMLVRPETITLFEDDFSDGDLIGWGITEFEGLTTQINSDGQMEITYGGEGTVNHGAYFEAFAGKVTYETDFRIDLNGCTSVDAGVFIIKGMNTMGSEKSLFNIKTYVGSKTFGAYDGGGGTRNTVKWEEGKTYRIQVVCDPVTDTYDFYVDNKPVIIGGKMRSDAGDVAAFTGVCINQQSLQGPAPTFFYDNMIIYSGDGVADTLPPSDDPEEEVEILEGVIITDDFSGDLSNWGIGSSTAAAINADGQLEVTLGAGNEGGVFYSLNKKIICSKQVAIEFDLKINGDTSTNFEAGFLLKNGTTTVANVAVRAGKMQAQYGAINATFANGTTYRIKVVSDPETKTIDVYVDGARVAQGKNYLNSATNWDGFQLMIKGNNGTAPLSACYDNLSIYVVEEPNG